MQLAGSLKSDNIEDYYWTPSALGYDRFVKFDHDFIGREALEAAQSKPRRVKRLLRWNDDDVAKIYRSQLSNGPLYKAIELPTPIYGWPQADEVRNLDGQIIGMSQFNGYTANERVLLSVSCIEEEHATPGTEVVITWGEPNGGSRKPHVERHEQTTIRATIHEAPYTGAAQQLKKSVL
jgi:glycine cleavage system aminomethyltransferase T